MFNQNNELEHSETTSVMLAVAGMVRLFTIIIGLGVTLFGVKYTYDIFSVLYEFLQKPEPLTKIIEKWSALLNLKDLFLESYPLDKLVTLIVLVIGVLLLLRVTLGFIHAGISILNTAIRIDNNSGHHTTHRAINNLDYKLTKLKKMATEGEISDEAYRAACDKYLVRKIMGD